MFCCFQRSLSNVHYNDTVKFVLPIETCKVIKVYDGDTVTVAFYHGGTLYRTQVRLLGIDCPEMKGPSEKEKGRAKLARDTLHDKIMDKVVELKKTSTEKYGRLLAEIWYRGENINEWMVRQGHAVPYEGDTKTYRWD
jgi:micrococcal nuclease